MKTKNMVTIVMALILLGTMTTHVKADSSALASKGIFQSDDGSIVFDSRDFDILASAIEEAKRKSYEQGFTEGKSLGLGTQGVGSLQGVSSGTIDCTGIDGWESLTVDDFVYGIERVSSGISNGGSTNGSYSMPRVGNGRSGTPTVSMSYDQSTGQLTVSGGMVYTEFYEFFTGRVGWYHDNGDAYYDNLYAGCNITTVNRLTVYLKK